MAIATVESYAAMLDAAKAGGYAFPAINITSSSTVTAAIQGFAEAESDGIIQVSVGGGQYASGSTIKDQVVGSLALAAYAREVAKSYGVTIALHTDHCHKTYLDSWLKPLLTIEAEQIAAGGDPIFNSHMWDGSTVPMEENLAIAEELLELSQKARTILEIEIGVVGGEEDGHSAEINDKLYSTPEDGIATIEKLGLGDMAFFIAAGDHFELWKPETYDAEERAKADAWLAEQDVFADESVTTSEYAPLVDPLNDEETLEDRARSYMHANCAHCHRQGGAAARSGLFLMRWQEDESRLGFCKQPVAAGAGTGGFFFDIVPGNAAESILTFRMNSTDPQIKMPELTNLLVDDFGVELVEYWIDSLEGQDCGSTGTQ